MDISLFSGEKMKKKLLLIANGLFLFIIWYILLYSPNYISFLDFDIPLKYAYVAGFIKIFIGTLIVCLISFIIDKGTLKFSNFLLTFAVAFILERITVPLYDVIKLNLQYFNQGNHSYIWNYKYCILQLLSLLIIGLLSFLIMKRRKSKLTKKFVI